ncbi:hypothetical protein CL634_10665 [bacterium]|nr:hypothetical protein [bacterium]
MYSSTQQVDDLWDDYFAKSDAIRERYASEVKDLQMYEESEREHYEYLWKVKEAGFGDDDEAYEAYWKRALDYYEQQGL